MRFGYLLVVLLLGAMGCSPRVDYDAGEGGDGALRSILALKESYVDGVQLLTDDVVIEGTITANNLLGEFPYSIVVEDDSSAIEIYLDQSRGVGRYLLGGRLRLVCSGLYMASDVGTMVLGSKPSPMDDYIVGSIYESEMLLRATVSAEGATQLAPRVVKISDLSASLVSCYVAIEDVTIVPSDTGGTVCARNPETGRFVSTIHRAVDSDGNTIDIYVPSTVSYADMAISSSRRTLYGIVDRYGSRYSLRLVCGFTSLMNF